MITDTEIMELRQDAAMFGDLEQVQLCNRALAGSETARDACELVIEYARGEAEADAYREELLRRYPHLGP